MHVVTPGLVLAEDKGAGVASGARLSTPSFPGLPPSPLCCLPTPLPFPLPEVAKKSLPDSATLAGKQAQRSSRLFIPKTGMVGMHHHARFCSVFHFGGFVLFLFSLKLGFSV